MQTVPNSFTEYWRRRDYSGKSCDQGSVRIAQVVKYRLGSSGCGYPKRVDLGQAGAAFSSNSQ